VLNPFLARRVLVQAKIKVPAMEEMKNKPEK
jgi:hypothetical protein